MVFQPRVGRRLRDQSQDLLARGHRNVRQPHGDQPRYGARRKCAVSAAADGDQRECRRPGGATQRHFPVHDDQPGSGVQDSRWRGTGTRRSSGNCRVRPPSRSDTSDAAESTISASGTSTSCCPERCRPIRASTRTRCGRIVGMGIVGLAENSGLSMYHGLQVSAQRRFATGLQFGVAYTYSELRRQRLVLTEVLPNAYTTGLLRDLGSGPHARADHRTTYTNCPFRGARHPCAQAAGELGALAGSTSSSPASLLGSATPWISPGVGAGSGNQFWNMEAIRRRDEDRLHGFAPRGLTRRRSHAGCRDLRRAAAQHPAQPRLLGVGCRIAKEFPVTASVSGSRFARVLQHPESSQLGRREFQSDQRSFGRSPARAGSRTIQLALKYIF